MKSYAVTSTRKARADVGTCVKCGKEIKAGDKYKYANPTPFLSGRVFFCETCEVDQNLIGKNKEPQKPQKTDAEVQKQVEEMTGTTVAEVEQKTTKEMPEPEPEPEQDEPKDDAKKVILYTATNVRAHTLLEVDGIASINSTYRKVRTNNCQSRQYEANKRKFICPLLSS